MHPEDAAALIAGAIPTPSGAAAGTRTWADLGAGRGTFTEALARLLGAGARVHAVDRERAAAAALAALAGRMTGSARIVPHEADFADARSWEALALPPLDGVLLANALHFVPAAEQAAVLARVAARLRDGGRLVVVEYADRAPSRWVPHPLSLARLGAILPAGTGPLRQVGSRPSAFGGSMYAAAADWRPARP